MASRPVPTASSRIRAGRRSDQRVEEGDVGRYIADVGEQLVVDVGDPVAVRLRSVPLHRGDILIAFAFVTNVVVTRSGSPE